MGKLRKVPRIIRIVTIDRFLIHCAFNNGEYRIIDFNVLLNKWKPKKSSLLHKLKDVRNLQQVEITNGTLSWPHIKHVIKLPTGQEFETFLDLDPIVLYEESVPDEKANKRYEIGRLLREERKKAGLTQQELAIRSGTTKNYISRIENNKSDIELRTLRKIIEIGLNRNLEIAVS